MFILTSKRFGYFNLCRRLMAPKILELKIWNTRKYWFSVKLCMSNGNLTKIGDGPISYPGERTFDSCNLLTAWQALQTNFVAYYYVIVPLPGAIKQHSVYLHGNWVPLIPPVGVGGSLLQRGSTIKSKQGLQGLTSPLLISTHWGRDKIDAILPTTFSNAFSWMKMYWFRLNFIELYSQGSNQQYSSIGSDNGLAPTRQQAIIWTSEG